MNICQKNLIHNKIKELEIYNKHDNIAITKLYEDIDIKKRQDDILVRTRKILEYKDMLTSGIMIEEKKEDAIASKSKSVYDNSGQEKKYKGISTLEYENDRKNRRLEKDMAFTLKLYEKYSDTIPDYIIKKLKSMPNNKGYIWKNMWVLGEKPKEDDTYTLYEKRDGISYIHEYKPDGSYNYIVKDMNKF
mgnify:CR=1 FL=1